MIATILGIVASIVAALLPSFVDWLSKQSKVIPAVQRSKRHDRVLKKHVEAIKSGDAISVATAWEYHNRVLRDKGITPRPRSSSGGQVGDSRERATGGVHRNGSVASGADRIRARFTIQPRKM